MKRFSLLLVCATLISACSTGVTASPSPTTDAGLPEEEIRALVTTFGERLQTVSLLAPDAAGQIEQQYAEFVSADLLQTWMADPSSAPGRLTSSPWPDRIEIGSVEAQGTDQYLVTGSVIEVTSVEQGTGDAAAQYPVQIIVSLIDGRWVISGWDAGDYQ